MRDYDPTLGRYLQADPLELVDGASVYGYALQNPRRYEDPTGEFAWGLALGTVSLIYQLYMNDWQLECVDWLDVGLWTVGGAGFGAFKHGAFASKNFGSHTWSATRSWMNRRGIQPINARQNRHHWFFEQGQGWGRNVPNWIKNQPWNTNPVGGAFNRWMGRGGYRHWLGAPAWFPESFFGLGSISFGGRGENCGCN